MSSLRSKRVCFSPDVYNTPTTIILKYDHRGSDGGRISRNKRRDEIGTNYCKKIISPPVRFLMQLGTKVASAIMRRKRSSSRKVSSSSSTLVRSRSISDLTDPHRAETVEDCIEFLHSSSCRERPSFS